jgi:hypothetical protein
MYREWSTVWLEQPIVVKVWYHSDLLFFRLREELWIGNMLVDRHKIWAWSSYVFICERLAAPVLIADRVHHLEVSICHRDCKTYCNISIDGEIIGGDVDVNVPQTDLENWSEIRRRRGFRHFLVEDSYFNILKLFRALTLYVLMFTAMSVFLCFMCAIPIPWDFASSLFLQYTAVAILGGLFGGLAIGFSHWRTWEKFYAQTLAHQRKFDAPPVRLEIDKPYVC